MTTDNPYSRILYWEVWNFMSVEHGKCEFDDRGIINFKGYNDSGKSAMMLALKVLLCNYAPTKHVKFIQDDKDYFRVLVAFDDGVVILRDKYINGQSLYEMYKDNQLIFSTKSGNALTKVSEVPQPIADYLGLVTFDGACLNARSRIEKRFGIETTGSENYKALNTILKSEEIAVASELLNNDKNRLASDIKALEIDLQAQKTLLGVGQHLTSDMIEDMKMHDISLDTLTTQSELLTNLSKIQDSIDSIVIVDEVDMIDVAQLERLAYIQSLISTLGDIVVAPELGIIDFEQMGMLTSIAKILESLEGVVVAPETFEIDNKQLLSLASIKAIQDDIALCDSRAVELEKTLSNLSVELNNLETELHNHGIKTVRCPDCGTVFNPEEQHVH